MCENREAFKREHAFLILSLVDRPLKYWVGRSIESLYVTCSVWAGGGMVLQIDRFFDTCNKNIPSQTSSCSIFVSNHWGSCCVCANWAESWWTWTGLCAGNIIFNRLCYQEQQLNFVYNILFCLLTCWIFYFRLPQHKGNGPRSLYPLQTDRIIRRTSLC